MTGWLDDPLGIVQATRFTHTDKWYMYKPDSLLEDDKHKFLWDPMGIVQATKFTNSDKWYLYKPDYLLEDDKHKFLRDFKIKTDHSVVQIRSLSD